MSKIKMFGVEHIIYLIVSLLITVALVFVIKKFVKKEKTQNIIVKVSVLIQLLLVILSRYTLIKYMTPDANPLPFSFCTIVASIFAIVVLFSKRNSFIINGICILALICGLFPTIIANYIGQGFGYGFDSLFFPPTIVSLLDHSWLFFTSLLMLVLGYVKLDINKWWSYPASFGLVSLYSVLYNHFTGSWKVAYIGNPLHVSSSLKIYLYQIFFYSTLVYTVFIFLYDLIKNKKDSFFPSLFKK